MNGGKVQVTFEKLGDLLKAGEELRGTEHAADWLRALLKDLPDDDLLRVFTNTGERLKHLRGVIVEAHAELSESHIGVGIAILEQEVQRRE